MATKHTPMTETKLRQLFKEGRGSGHGPDYRSFITVFDLSSIGQSRRVPSIKVGRTLHLLSGLEHNVYLLLERSKEVIDIREQYPLDRDQTLEVASRLGLKHPVYPHSEVPVVMTVDFLVDFVRDGKRSVEAIAVKTSAELRSKRSVAKLEIARTTLQDMGIPHHLILDTKLPHRAVENIQWIYSARSGDDETTENGNSVEAHLDDFEQQLKYADGLTTARAACESFDAARSLEAGTSIRLLKRLMIERRVRAPLTATEILDTPLGEITTSGELP
ncbi:TnsA endonuclease N-terminal domain-containing protein [Achromobacter anxifer]|uniref:TnsA endonuclease N-terminal domain-containing protein n=1 Tax=Achromobacter anxifer TaxID=1287737 RepID=UPI0023F83068|nr:TnsA endonuclease N-terminal domain-containing protein [Achromobacter anxifer]MDF8365303.1 TnsA endonuclease N-terminal domain-containing protein [Achromobacter anxifer]